MDEALLPAGGIEDARRPRTIRGPPPKPPPPPRADGDAAAGGSRRPAVRQRGGSGASGKAEDGDAQAAPCNDITNACLSAAGGGDAAACTVDTGIEKGGTELHGDQDDEENAQRQPPPPGWELRLSRSHEVQYYYHVATGTSVWDYPEEA
mmetsp:Transcript_78981/g.255241  ORF Transcript_78981/g.255241 Transcript_78981/m.255241 type:complete len:150 (+) Transcript_78981:409-858(+)